MRLHKHMKLRVGIFLALLLLLDPGLISPKPLSVHQFDERIKRLPVSYPGTMQALRTAIKNCIVTYVIRKDLRRHDTLASKVQNSKHFSKD